MRTCFLLFVIGASLILNAQRPEFTVHSNGLMYNDTTMEQLHFIVDSLNLKFKSCELHKTFRAKSQALAHHISLKKDQVQEAREDMKRGISPEAFIKKYPKAEVQRNLLVVPYRYTAYDGEKKIEFSEVAYDGGYGREIEIKHEEGAYNQKRKNSWLLKYWPGSEYSDESVSAFYFVTEFKQPALPETYARMVQYSECMVDTNAQIFFEGADKTGVRYRFRLNSAAQEFIDYVHNMTNYPTMEVNMDNYEEYHQKYAEWDSTRWVMIEEELLKEEEFQNLLTEAVRMSLDSGGTDDEFEEYVMRYHSAEAVLHMKRSRRVVGGCSRDQAPRYHALKIALLSAETVNWETFLRAHLDIMNDRFERVSDGSYAWGERGTYIRELEELEIDVQSLLLGISLRVENPGQNHYFGSIHRIGRALAESQNREKIDSTMLAMIRDNELDDYNRLLAYFLFLNCNHYLEDEELKRRGKESLKLAIAEMPEYMVSQLELE